MSVYVCLYMYACICMHVFVCMYSVYVYVCIHGGIVWGEMCVYVCVHVCICVYAYMYMYVCIRYGGNCLGGNVLPKTGGGIVRGGSVRGNCPTPDEGGDWSPALVCRVQEI